MESDSGKRQQKSTFGCFKLVALIALCFVLISPAGKLQTIYMVWFCLFLSMMLVVSIC